MTQVTEQTIETPAGPLTYLLHQPSPDHRAAEPALLLTFAATAHSALTEAPQDIPFRRFADEDHYVVAFDLPHHGSRVGHFGSGIDGLCRAFMAGHDPFAHFVDDGRAVINTCLEQGIGQNGKIVACGVSRAGYCALRLAAADSRIQGVAALAPVTDWRRLHEFATVQERPEVAALAIDGWAEQLANRALYLAIGNQDGRVGTDCCLRFAHRLFTAEGTPQSSQPDTPRQKKQVHVVASPGHSLANEWRSRGAEFLLQTIDTGGRDQ